MSRPHFGQSWNPYSYVHNSPLNFTDPSGFEGAPSQGRAVGEDGVPYATLPYDVVRPGPVFTMAQNLSAASAGSSSSQKDAARDDTVARLAPSPVPAGADR